MMTFPSDEVGGGPDGAVRPTAARAMISDAAADEQRPAADTTNSSERALYNLLVTASVGAWDLPAYEFDSTRFLEHTADTLRSKYKKLTASAIEELRTFPTLFAYEGRDEQVRVGYIRRIRERGRSILIEYDFDESIAPFSFEVLLPLRVQLDIGDWEMSRTHWALKDEELFEVLASAGLVARELVAGEGQPGRVEEMRFKVALSFPGEHRDYVADVAEEVKKRLGRGAVFYDKDLPPSWRARTSIRCCNEFTSAIQIWSLCSCARTTRRRSGVALSGEPSDRSSRTRTTKPSCSCGLTQQMCLARCQSTATLT
jgi:hypothetical protein